MKSNKNEKQIVVVGGGFAGLNFARKLFKNKYYEVTLVDKHNYNYFTPLLYQVATSFLEPAAISYPFRKILEKKNIGFRMAEVVRVDTDARQLYLRDGGELNYDFLVFASGSQTNFFGNKSLQNNSFAVKGIDDALYMRNQFIKTLEKASVEKDIIKRQKLLTIVIAGGGPTGVELAGMMAELKNGILAMDYPELRNDLMSIYLIEGTDKLLPTMSQKTHKEAYEALKDLGVIVKLNTRVNYYENEMVHLSDETVIETNTLIWAAGVTVNTFDGIAQGSLGRGNRMITDQFNKVKSYENIFAIGDISIQFTDSLYPNGHPQLAQPAIQDGKALAKNLLRTAKGKAMKPFKYFDRGEMAIIGRKWAVADLFKHKMHIGGFLGLMAWLFIHLLSLVNYNNKIRTLYSWLVAYLTHDQVLRMIFHSEKPEKEHSSVSTEKEEEQLLLFKQRFSREAVN
jgi:NADH:ubiquinone reductase (H+-translocating)